jgi:hypothetical protein
VLERADSRLCWNERVRGLAKNDISAVRYVEFACHVTKARRCLLKHATRETPVKRNTARLARLHASDGENSAPH